MNTTSLSTRLGITLALLFSSACDPGGGGAAFIDSTGGDVFGAGATVTIPAGALTSETLVEVMVAPASLSTMPTGMELAGDAIAFTPHGTRFTTPVRISLPHDGTATGAMRLDDEYDTTWEPVATREISEFEVVLDVDGFSIYAAVRTGSADGGTSVPLGDAGMVAPPVQDAGSADAGSADAGSADAGSADAGSADAGSADAGSADAGSADAGSADAGSGDAGSADAGSSDGGSSPDAGSSDGGSSPDAGGSGV